MKKKPLVPQHTNKAPVPKHTTKPAPELKEAVTPKAETVHESMVACKGCDHGNAAHYGSSERWCNISGCQCQAYK